MSDNGGGGAAVAGVLAVGALYWVCYFMAMVALGSFIAVGIGAVIVAVVLFVFLKALISAAWYRDTAAMAVLVGVPAAASLVTLSVRFIFGEYHRGIYEYIAGGWLTQSGPIKLLTFVLILVFLSILMFGWLWAIICLIMAAEDTEIESIVMAGFSWLVTAWAIGFVWWVESIR